MMPDCGGGVSRRTNCVCITRRTGDVSEASASRRSVAYATCGEQSHRGGRSGNATCDTMMRFDATRGRVTPETACRWYSRESEVFFSHSTFTPSPRYPPFSSTRYHPCPADYQINKGEYQIKLRS